MYTCLVASIIIVLIVLVLLSMYPETYTNVTADNNLLLDPYYSRAPFNKPVGEQCHPEPYYGKINYGQEVASYCAGYKRPADQ